MRRLLIALIALLAAPLDAASIILDSTSASLELSTSSAAQVDVLVRYNDVTTTSVIGGIAASSVSSATTSTVLASPAASTRRGVEWVSIRNRSTTAAQTLQLKVDISGSERYLGSAVSLRPGETLLLGTDGGPSVVGRTGITRRHPMEISFARGSSSIVKNYPLMYVLPAAFSWPTTDSISGNNDGGVIFSPSGGHVPGMSFGTPGINGYFTDCSAATNTSSPRGALEMGAYQLVTTGLDHYITAMSVAPFLEYSAGDVFQRGFFTLIDILWYNRVASSTGGTQTITWPGTMPARDANGGTDGVGLNWGYASLENLNLAASCSCNANMQVSYTNSDGTGSRTGLRFMAFQVTNNSWLRGTLQAGDRGVKQIDSMSYVGTNVGNGGSLILYRPLATLSITRAGFPNYLDLRIEQNNAGVRVWDGSCIVGTMVWVGTQTNVVQSNDFATVQGHYQIEDR